MLLTLETVWHKSPHFWVDLNEGFIFQVAETELN